MLEYKNHFISGTRSNKTHVYMNFFHHFSVSRPPLKWVPFVKVHTVHFLHTHIMYLQSIVNLIFRD